MLGQWMTRLQRKPIYAWLVWGLGASFFFAEYFARVAPSVMVSDLMQSYAVSATGLGVLSSCFYYSYLVMQLPVGALTDRFGPRRLLSFSAVVCALGCVGFACAHDLWLASFSRFLTGFGASFAFVGTLKIATQWFPSRRLGMLAGLTQALGMLGAAVGEAPVAVAVENMGWRHTLLLMGGVIFLLAILIFLAVRDLFSARSQEADSVTESKERPSTLWQDLLCVLRNRHSWVNALYAGFLFMPTTAFGELWGTTYLAHTHFMSTTRAATVVSSMFIGFACGGALVGHLSDRWQKRRPVLLLSALASLLSFSVLLYVGSLDILGLSVAAAIYGFSNTGLGVSYALAGELNPAHCAGVSMAFTNLMSVIIGTLFQPLIGWFLDLQWQGQWYHHVHSYSPQAYKWAVSAMPLSLAVAAVLACFCFESGAKAFAARR